MSGGPSRRQRIDTPVALGVYLPFVIFIMRETRSTVILTRKARKLRKERGDADGGIYRSRAEEVKLPFVQAMKLSLIRPLGQSCAPCTRPADGA